jgi:hypothetical protein
MKRNWITRGVPVVALTILVAVGMMSCSTDPVSSPDTNSSTYSIEAEATVPDQYSALEAGNDLYIMSGHLRMDESGECWYLIVRAGEAYELLFGDRMREQHNGRDITVRGQFPQTIQPRCSNWPVFKVQDLKFSG